MENDYIEWNSDIKPSPETFAFSSNETLQCFSN